MLRDHACRVSFFFQISARIRGTPQVLQLQRHREHAFQLPVEMDLVAGKPIESLGIDASPNVMAAKKIRVGAIQLRQRPPPWPGRWFDLSRDQPVGGGVGYGAPTRQQQTSRKSDLLR
jgi:hypothetical protein